MDDHEIVLAIQEVLDGTEWNSATPAYIAEILETNGYYVGDLRIPPPNEES